MRLNRWLVLIFIVLVSAGLSGSAVAHRSPCHRWHSCPSERGTYVCGDTGRCGGCPDNQHCQGGAPKSASEEPQLPKSPPDLVLEPKQELEQKNENTTILGHPRVVDGDTLHFGKEKVRIQGIDAPERHQKCRNASGEMYGCGKEATEALKARIGQKEVVCEGDSRGQYGRLIGTCYFSDGVDLNGWMVRQGHALAYRRYSTEYVGVEAAAKTEELGIWGGEFVEPWKWRRGERLVENIPDRRPPG